MTAKSFIKSRGLSLNRDICIDFDGTIIEEVKFPEVGKLKPGALEAIKALKAKGYRILIFSARNNPDIWNQEARFNQMVELLEQYQIPYDEIILTPKPRYLFLIDDRAIRFSTWNEALEVINANSKIT